MYSFLDPQEGFPLPRHFCFAEYLSTEQELWALFPETEGRRVNFCQIGLTARIFVESTAEGDLGADETYFLMPCADSHLRPVRMQSIRRLTLDEFRMSHLTARKMAELLAGTGRLMDEVHFRILGPGVMDGY